MVQTATQTPATVTTDNSNPATQPAITRIFAKLDDAKTAHEAALVKGLSERNTVYECKFTHEGKEKTRFVIAENAQRARSLIAGEFTLIAAEPAEGFREGRGGKSLAQQLASLDDEGIAKAQELLQKMLAARSAQPAKPTTQPKKK